MSNFFNDTRSGADESNFVNVAAHIWFVSIFVIQMNPSSSISITKLLCISIGLHLGKWSAPRSSDYSIV